MVALELPYGYEFLDGDYRLDINMIPSGELDFTLRDNEPSSELKIPYIARFTRTRKIIRYKDQNVVVYTSFDPLYGVVDWRGELKLFVHKNENSPKEKHP